MYKRVSFLLLVIACQFANAQRGTLLVANKAENTVSLFDVATGKLLNIVPTLGEAPHELAVSPDGKTAVACNYGGNTPGNTVAVIDITAKSNAGYQVISTDKYARPHGIEFISDKEVLVTSELTKNLFTVNIGNGGTLQHIANTGQERTHMVTWSPKDAMAYVTNIVSGTVSAVDVPGKKIVKLVSLRKGVEGISVSPDGKQVWVVSREDSNLYIIDTGTWSVQTLPQRGTGYRVKILPDGKYAIITNGVAGTVSVYDVAKRKKVQVIDLTSLRDNAPPDIKGEKPLHPVPGGIAASSDSRYVFISCTGYRLAAMIDTANWQIVKHFVTGLNPDGIYYSRYESR